MRTRRDVLQLALCAAASLAACRGEHRGELPEGAIAVPLAELPPGVHVTRRREEEPVDLLRAGDQVIARSLFCTHMGCVTAWDPALNGFRCPCHGGAFDADGRPSAGPPIDPLRLLPVTLAGDHVVVERMRIRE